MSQNPKTPFGDTTKAVIAHHFGRWTAYSALKSGRHVKSRDRVLKGLDAICFDPLFDSDRGEIDEHKGFSDCASTLLPAVRRQP